MTYEPLRQNQTAASALPRAAIDAGLQSHMRSVYNTMCWGLGVTGLSAFICGNVPAVAKLVLYSPLGLVFAFAPLIFLMFGLTPAKMLRMPTSKARNMFIGFCALMGVSFTYLFVVYSGASIARVFFITSGMFAAMSLYGYVTKKDLSGMGHFMTMGMMGIFIASLVQMGMSMFGEPSPMLHFVISIVGVLVFTGLTAWETQVIKETYAAGNGRETNEKLAIIGALSLYMCFINLFQFMMSLMGQRD